MFDQFCKEHHRQAQNCINSSDTIISYELEDNLDLFPNVDFDELEASPTEELEDELNQSHSEYQVGSIVKVIDKDEDYTEWAVFEVIECLHNEYIHDRNNSEAYLNHVDWYYCLVSHFDGNAMLSENFSEDKSLWVAENEICDFDLAHNVCTEDIF